MAINNYFSMRRLLLLMRNNIYLKRRSIFTVIYSMTGLMILLNLIAPPGSRDLNYYSGLFVWLYLIIGFWFSSKTFAVVHDARKGPAFLLLPCSSLEKFLSGLLLMSIGYTLLAVAFFYLFSLIMWAISWYMFHYSQPIFNPLDPYILKCMECYMVIQSVLLLGSITFRSHVITKTLFFVCLLAILLVVLYFIVSLIFKHAAPPKLSFSTILTLAGHYVFWYLLAPICWIMTYLRLRACEN